MMWHENSLQFVPNWKADELAIIQPFLILFTVIWRVEIGHYKIYKVNRIWNSTWRIQERRKIAYEPWSHIFIFYSIVLIETAIKGYNIKHKLNMGDKKLFMIHLFFQGPLICI